MPVTVRGGDILFNDGSTQSTAAGAPTTTQVLNATAAAAIGAVGTYIFANNGGNATLVQNATVAGSTLYPTGATNLSYYTGNLWTIPDGTALSGTWRVMGRAGILYNGCGYFVYSTLFLRIS